MSAANPSRMPFRDRMAREASSRDAKSLRHVHRVGVAPTQPVQGYLDPDGPELERSVLMFGSNSYLGLNTHPYVVDRVRESVAAHGVGSGGSPYFSGYTQRHQDLERRLAALSGHDDAVLVPSGYVANLCWLTAVMRRDDVLLYDKYSHASALDAMRMAEGTFIRFDPEDLDAFRTLVQDQRQRLAPRAQIFATFEGVRSIDGTVVDLEGVVGVCGELGVFSVLDDAHSLGVLGKQGRGTIEYFGGQAVPDMRVATCSKAIGAQGAFVAGPADVVGYLRSNATPYLFTTAMSHPTLAAIDAALDLLDEPTDRLHSLHTNRSLLADGLRRKGIEVGDSVTGILPVHVRQEDMASLSRRLFGAGLFVNVVEYPMIGRRDKSYLRFSVMGTHKEFHITSAIDILISNI